MKKTVQKSLLLLAVVTSLLCAEASAQRGGDERFICKQEVFAHLKPLPKLSYECRADAVNDFDESILKWPERLRAINHYMRTLRSLSASGWWQAGVDDLNACYFRGRAGEFDEDEKERFRRGDYSINLFGNDRVRLVLTPDPCYQTGYGGSNAFLLYRRNQGVYVTQVLDGYFSRADNAVALAFADTGRGQVIEVSTGTGGLNPYVTNYYFEIDQRTGRAVPKRIFKEGKRLTNKVTSVAILDDGSFPQGYAELEVIKGNRLADRFYTYEDAGDEGSLTDGSGRKLRRSVYKWNGQYYTRQRREG